MKYREIRTTACYDCRNYRNRPNSLDRFLDDFKDSELYCEHFKKDLKTMGAAYCDNVIPLYNNVPKYPMVACDECGYYTYLSYSMNEKHVCWDCRRRGYSR